MKISVDISPFMLPNYVSIKALGNSGTTVDVGKLSDQEASDYWDSMKVEWMKHVNRRRNQPVGAEDEQ